MNKKTSTGSGSSSKKKYVATSSSDTRLEIPAPPTFKGMLSLLDEEDFNLRRAPSHRKPTSKDEEVPLEKLASIVRSRVPTLKRVRSQEDAELETILKESASYLMKESVKRRSLPNTSQHGADTGNHLGPIVISSQESEKHLPCSACGALPALARQDSSSNDAYDSDWSLGSLQSLTSNGSMDMKDNSAPSLTIFGETHQYLGPYEFSIDTPCESPLREDMYSGAPLRSGSHRIGPLLNGTRAVTYQPSEDALPELYTLMSNGRPLSRTLSGNNGTSRSVSPLASHLSPPMTEEEWRDFWDFKLDE
jgi:hypothetical protein